MARSAREAARIGNVINIVMGVGLFVSAFFWAHTAAPRTNMFVTGFIIAALALAALIRPSASWVDVLPAIWLIGSAMWIDNRHATAFISAAVGAVVFMASLAPIAAVPIDPTNDHGGRSA